VIQAMFFCFWFGSILFLKEKVAFLIFVFCFLVFVAYKVLNYFLNKNNKSLKGSFFTLIFKSTTDFLKFLALSCFFIFLGFFLSKKDFSKRYLENHVFNFSGNLTFSGKVEDVCKKIDKEELVVSKIEVDGKKVFGKVVVNKFLYPEVKKYETLLFKCNLRRIESLANNDSYEKYLNSKGIFLTCSYPEISLIKGPSKIEQIFLDVRNSFLKRVKKIFPEPSSTIISGLTIGEESGITRSLKESFQKSGLSHILVVSGSNISLLISFLDSVLANFIQRKKRVYFLIFLSLFYAAIVGFEPPTIRAVFLAIVASFGKSIGREVDLMRVLFLFGLLFSILNPLSLSYNISFQLSFFASFGIVAFSENLKKLFKPLGETFSEIFSTTLSAQISVIPLSSILFQNFKILETILSNLLVLWIVPIATVLGFLIVSLSFFSLKISIFVGFFEWVIISWIIFVARIFDF